MYQEFKHIKLFQYGINPNNAFISQSVVEDNIHTFINQPVCIFNEKDLYNNRTQILGIIKQVTELKDNVVYGDVLIFSKYHKGIVNLTWRNYEIGDIDHHEENGIYYIDKFRLLSVSYNVEKEYKEDVTPNLEVFDS